MVKDNNKKPVTTSMRLRRGINRISRRREQIDDTGFNVAANDIYFIKEHILYDLSKLREFDDTRAIKTYSILCQVDDEDLLQTEFDKHENTDPRFLIKSVAMLRESKKISGEIMDNDSLLREFKFRFHVASDSDGKKIIDENNQIKIKNWMGFYNLAMKYFKGKDSLEAMPLEYAPHDIPVGKWLYEVKILIESVLVYTILKKAPVDWVEGRLQEGVSFHNQDEALSLNELAIPTSKDDLLKQAHAERSAIMNKILKDKVINRLKTDVDKYITQIYLFTPLFTDTAFRLIPSKYILSLIKIGILDNFKSFGSKLSDGSIPKGQIWIKRIKQLRYFKYMYGHVHISRRHFDNSRIKTEVAEEEHDRNIEILYNWIQRVRKSYVQGEHLDDELLDELKELGFLFSSNLQQIFNDLPELGDIAQKEQLDQSIEEFSKQKNNMINALDVYEREMIIRQKMLDELKKNKSSDNQNKTGNKSE